MGARPSKRFVRGVAGLVLVLGVGLLVGSALADPATQPVADSGRDDDPGGPGVGGPTGTSGATDGRGVTVVATQGFYTGLHPGDRDTAELVAFDADGTVVYYNATYQVYFDVDPVPGRRLTVEYVAAERVNGPPCRTDVCSRNVVERVNLSTGAVTRVYDAVTPKFQTGRWHDVDRLNATHLVVADIVYNRVYAVDIRTDATTWQWNASAAFPPKAGGPPGDWTHLNDVEALADGRVMASLRNMDSVVFIEPGRGVDDDWTLGSDDAHDVLNEPHNPDFIPADRGGPAVVVADSENNRVIEYRRVAGRWRAAWSWRDRTLQWPRDADRLPNGHTLVVDSHGDRVVEVDPSGAAVWHVDIGRPYDAERLGTGDESAGGYAAGVTFENRTAAGPLDAPPAAHQRPVDPGLVVALKDAVPGRVVNGLLFLAPPWVQFTDLVVAGVVLLDVLVWAGVEWRWSERSVRRAVRRSVP